MMISSSQISVKRQITIPLKVMIHLKLHPGDRIIFEEKNGHIEIKPPAEKFTIRHFVKEYSGHTSIKLTDKEIRAARQEAWAQKKK